MIGKIIDNYKIIDILGKGGMGVVYKAHDTELDMDVALKMMESTVARDESSVNRFRGEARALAKMKNPNIVVVHALRQTDFGLYIVMEFVDGNTLAQRIEENGPIPLKTVLEVFRQLLSALDHAHKLGIIHRDLKPSNIMLTPDGVVKVTDFGLAKVRQSSASTMTVGTGGTLYYMSPEAIEGISER